MIMQGAQPILAKEKTMDSSIWRSIMFFIVLISAISMMGRAFFPGR
jgi:hypothetical protein